MGLLGDIGDFVGGVGGLAASIYNGNENRKAQEKINQQNYNTSKEFAQNSIQWKVADAKKAGIHPLAALGTNASYAPTAMSDSGQSDTPRYVSGVISSLGQIAEKAVDALNSNSKKDLSEQLDGKQTAQNVTPTAENITKTNPKSAIKVVNNSPESAVALSEKTAPLFQLNPVNDGFYNFTLREGSTEAEAYSEMTHPVKLAYGYMQILPKAVAKARELNRLDPKAHWIAKQSMSGDIYLININNERTYKDLDFMDKLDAKIQRWRGRETGE